MLSLQRKSLDDDREIFRQIRCRSLVWKLAFFDSPFQTVPYSLFDFGPPFRLTSADPASAVDLDPNLLSDPADVRAAMECVRLCRDIGNAPALQSFRGREACPGELAPAALEQFVRNAAVPFWHYTGSAKMGRDSASVVDGRLRVYGIDSLRVADGSIMPQVTTGNTMAPCVIIGERAGGFIRNVHRL